MQAGLDQSLARLTGDHRLQFRRGESVDVTGLRGHEQHHLCSCQRTQFVSLLHHSRLSLRKSCVASQFVLYVLHLDLDSASGFLAWCGHGLARCLVQLYAAAVVCIADA